MDACVVVAASSVQTCSGRFSAFFAQEALFVSISSHPPKFVKHFWSAWNCSADCGALFAVSTGRQFSNELLWPKSATHEKVWVYQLKQSSKNIETSSTSNDTRNDTFLESSKLTGEHVSRRPSEWQHYSNADLRIVCFFWDSYLANRQPGHLKENTWRRTPEGEQVHLAVQWKNAFKRTQLHTLIKNTLQTSESDWFLECIKSKAKTDLLVFFSRFRWLMAFERTKL